MSTAVTLAAAADAIAPIKAAVLALGSFVVLMLLAFTDTGPSKLDPKGMPASESDQPLEDQVGT